MTKQTIIIIVAAVVIIGIILLIWKPWSSDRASYTGTGGGGSGSGSGSATGFDVLGTYCAIFPKSKLCGGGGYGGGGTKKYCNCSKPGYAVDGAADSLCNAGNIAYEQDCA